MGSIAVDASSDMSRRLMPMVVDQIAETEPDTVWAAVPISTKTSPRYLDISYRQFANAINGIAWWLEKELGRGDTTEPLAYFGSGSSDIGYIILLVGAVKAGYFVSLFTTVKA